MNLLNLLWITANGTPMLSLTLIVKDITQMVYLIIIENLDIENIYFLPWGIFYATNTFSNPSFKGCFHSSIWNILFKKKKNMALLSVRKNRKIFLHMYLSTFWLSDQMKIWWFYAFYSLGRRKVTTSILFPSLLISVWWNNVKYT